MLVYVSECSSICGFYYLNICWIHIVEFNPAGVKGASQFMWSVMQIAFPRVHMTSQRSSSCSFSCRVLYKREPHQRPHSPVRTLEEETNCIMAGRTLAVACALLLGMCIITSGKPTDTTHAYCKIVWWDINLKKKKKSLKKVCVNTNRWMDRWIFHSLCSQVAWTAMRAS